MYSALIKSPKLIFKPDLRTAFPLSIILNFKRFGVLSGGKLSLEKLCQIENSKQANFSGFQQPAMTLKINPQKNNLTQITCKLFNSKFLSSKQDCSMTQSKQSEVYEKVLFAFIRGVCRDT